MGKNYTPSWKTEKQPDGTFNVVVGNRTVAKGFENRSKAQAYIAELMTNYKAQKEKDK